ncbi:nucleotidyltransferase family protein [Oceanihabitans sp. 2_MG-2023]|uniref:nucleotidyltransferase family protein n=1 Tax=Oceanihabitans sp. 2_MG-2023 TaxID=3062661 RepID=UPI0026E44BE3|nr:nucleotidyltransferase family protein [Oceanihabitans sp. 2_MG-2023]MDO6595884.1 nucleotidyltransferase family protein [Oceanihabitans sp. 2_MG-2023]
MRQFIHHLLPAKSTIKEALVKLNELGFDAILFVVDKDNKLIGSLTDGDIRRGLITGITIEHNVLDVIQDNPRFVRKGESNLKKIIEYREGNFKIIPVLDKDNIIVNVINFRFFKSYLPIDAVVMAGGRGQRLRPLTDNTPKPLLKIGDKPIIEHNIDRLVSYGVDDFWLSVRYLGEQLEDYFKDGSQKNIKTDYIWETEPLGTIGAISKVDNFQHDYILVTNSDILTNLDYEDFFLSFLESGADLSVVTIPYDVKIPYAVLETNNNEVLSFKEKPTYTYYSNGGIYLMKKEVLDLIPKNAFFNATDLMEALIDKNFKVHSYPLRGYWLDIGKHEDFKQAQEDIQHIKF